MEEQLTAKHLQVVAALIRQPGHPNRILVQQRPPHKSHPLQWEFPGGKVEQGESPQEALARECKEEMSIVIQVGPSVWQVQHTYPHAVVDLEVFSATLIEGSPVAHADSAQEIRWCSPAEMSLLSFCEADVPLIEALARGLLKGD